MQADNGSPFTRILLLAGSLLLGLTLGGLLVWGVLALAFLPNNDLLGTLIGTNVNPKLPWYLTRASGTVAYLLLTASTAWGVVLSTKVANEVSLAPFSLAMHNALAWVALGLVGLHAWLLMLDDYYLYLPADLLVPFTGPYRPGWVGLGTLSLYLMFLLSASFGWRKFIKQKSWRLLHYLGFPLFVLVTLHGLMAGTDSSQLGMQVMYAGSGLLILFMTYFRVLVAIKRSRDRAASTKLAQKERISGSVEVRSRV